MLRHSKFKELIAIDLVNKLTPHMTSLGFKYSKTKTQFIRQQGVIQQVFSIPYLCSSVYYEEASDKIYFSFKLSSGIEIPKYDKWYTELTGDRMQMQHTMDEVYSAIELPAGTLLPEDFYQPVSAREFKRNIAGSLATINIGQADSMSFEKVISQGLPKLIAAMDPVLDAKSFYEILPKPQYVNYTLLIFGGYMKEARALFDAAYEAYVNSIESYQSSDPATAVSLAGHLEVLIAYANMVLKNNYSNPFTRIIKVRDPQQDTYNFGPELQFKESLRFDIDGFKIIALLVNAAGEILIVENYGNIFKYNAKGEQLFKKSISPEIGGAFNNPKTGCLSETAAFFVNNYIIDKDNNCLELPLPVVEEAGIYRQSADITDLVYFAAGDQYLVLYKKWFIIYDNKGNVEKQIVIEANRYNSIVAEKNWIVSHQYDASNTLLNFEGEKIKTLPIAHGNDNYLFSHSKNQLICFFYSAKSQYYDLLRDREEDLWAHPTYLKGYKDAMYNDINHNFGLTVAAFSPDDQYIVGGADHGKYVAWRLPSLERVELIPQAEVINMLDPYTYTEYKDGMHTEYSYKPSLVHFEGQTYLKNRGNDVNRILFFDKGDLFVMLLDSGIAMVWNRLFKNLGAYKTNGVIHWHADKYLSQQREKDIVIYTRL